MRKKNIPNMSISIELGEEKRLSGKHLFALLENIHMYGSISQAASELGMSYRYFWGLLRDAEKTMDIKLINKRLGGHSGGGASLTEEGKALLNKYKTFKNEVDKNLENFLKETDEEIITSMDQLMPSQPLGKHLLLASTIEPVETGLLDVLEQAFYQETGILIKHIAVGSGRALQIAKEGRVDMVLSHAPALEDKFMDEGFGKLKVSVMTNNYVIVAPKSESIFDMGNRTGDVSPIDAFKKIAEAKALFISRADMSGTHLKEQELWQAAGITPEGKWYIKSSSVMGNLSVLQLAMEKNAFTIVDYATFLLANAGEKMFIISGGNQKNHHYEYLNNTFSLILLNPDFMPGVHFNEASIFADWIQKENTRNIIANFGIHNYGEPLFCTL